MTIKEFKEKCKKYQWDDIEIMRNTIHYYYKDYAVIILDCFDKTIDILDSRGLYLCYDNTFYFEDEGEYKHSIIIKISDYTEDQLNKYIKGIFCRYKELLNNKRIEEMEEDFK